MKFKTKRYYFYYIVRCIGPLFSILPLRLAVFMAARLSGVAYALLGHERKKTLRHLRESLKGKGVREIKKIAKGVFSNLGMHAMEIFHIYKLNRRNIDRWVTVKGREKLDCALQKGKGVILLSAHIGNWELIPICLTFLGYKGCAVRKRIRFHMYDTYFNKLMAPKDARFPVVYRDESPKKILRVLKDNGVVGMLADQDIDSVDGVFVDFFGKPAYTATAPVAIALASKAEILPCFIIRKGHGHEIIVEDPVKIEKEKSKQETLKVNTQKWSRVVESYVMRYPEQWVWMHRRWKTRPEFVKRET